MMWIIHPVFIITLHMFFFSVLADNTKEKTSDTELCKVLHPLLYGIICFLVFLVVVLLILLFEIISRKSDLRRDHMTSDTGEATALRPNNALSVSPLSDKGGDDSSSSTSSGTPEGSLADLSSISQRYASLQERSKTSDYINVSESVSPGQVDYVNVKESRRKKINRKGQASCDDGTTSVSSDSSNESAVNYSMVVFTKTDK